jgi:hypothetical protein
MSEPHLRVVPGATGEVADELDGLPAAVLAARVRTLRAQVEGLTRDLGLAEEDMRALRASRNAFKGLLTKMQRVDPQAEVIEATLAYWRVTCHGPRSRVETPLDGKRADAVRKTIKRLVEHDPDPELANPDAEAQAAALCSATDRAVAHIKQAVDAAARFPFEGRYGRRFAEMAPGLKRKVDIVYILRDEIKLEQFANLMEGDARRIAYAHDLHARLVAQPNLRLVFASLDPSMGEILCRAIKWAQSLERPPS